MQKIINLGILAHVDAGKTTVTEALLVYSGVKAHGGRVDHGTATTDSMSIERRRGMTVRAATISFFHQDIKINLIDTPGHMDFFAEVERSLSVLDCAVLVVSAREGVQPQTRVIFHKLRDMGIPTLFFVNKIDRVGVSIKAVLRDMERLLTPNMVVMQRVLHEGGKDAAVEMAPLTQATSAELLIERDEALMEAFLQGGKITEAQLLRSLQAGIRQGQAFPVFFGAALHHVGIGPLLDAIGLTYADTCKREGPLSAKVYKTEWDEKGHKRLYVRVFDGQIRIREKIAAQGHEHPVQVKSLMALQNGRIVPAECVESGDIAVLLDMPDIRCGCWFGETRKEPFALGNAKPMLSVGVMPETPADRPALLSALQQLREEDPMLELQIKPDTGEICASLYGALQRDIIEALLLERYGLRARFSTLQTRFAEKPTQRAEAEIRIWKAGNQHEAGIALTVEPLPTGSGNAYTSAVSYGDLERPFQNAVAEGVSRGLAEGLGYEVVDTRVTFVDMDYSSVTSTPADFRRLAPLVLQKALQNATLKRLEPWLSFIAYAPLEQQKRVLSALSNIRAVIFGVSYEVEEVVVHGEVPLDTSKTFAAELLSLTQGRGLFQTAFLAYRPVASPGG